MAYWELHKSCSLSCTSEEPTAPVNYRNLCQCVCVCVCVGGGGGGGGVCVCA